MSKTNLEIEQEVLQVIAQALNTDVTSIALTDHINDLSNDSIQLFELLVAFEKHYALEAAYEDVLTLETVADIVAYVRRIVYKGQ
jgi:acyl carrier protein